MVVVSPDIVRMTAATVEAFPFSISGLHIEKVAILVDQSVEDRYAVEREGDCSTVAVRVAGAYVETPARAKDGTRRNLLVHILLRRGVRVRAHCCAVVIRTARRSDCPHAIRESF